ncbi:MAG: UvrD-helicase domain-containing protein [Clostridia bacterium]|nr:UvrD-helicase domain-containing protein [Clostridia bacterium]
MNDTTVELSDDRSIAEEDKAAREFTVHGFNDLKKNLLLSASAGSGKTRTLVDRIVARTEELPEDRHIDSFLVVTYTEAAAGELREKIAKALGKKAEEALKNGEQKKAFKLFEEKMLIPHATIGTIDSFMLKVVREHFAEANVNPVFKIDNDEVARIYSEAADKVLEEYYGSKEAAEVMNRLADVYSSQTDDADLKKKLFEKLIDFCENLPNPEAWLNSVVKTFETEGDVRKNYWYGLLKEDFLSTLRDAKECFEKLAEYAGKYVPDAAVVYKKNCISQLESDANKIDACIKRVTADDGNMPALFEPFFEIAKFDNIVQVKGKEKTEEASRVYSAVKTGREAGKNHAQGADGFVNGAICSYKALKPSEQSPEWKQKVFLAGIRAVGSYVGTIVKITKEILDEANGVCRRRGVFSFSQVAHMALKLLNKGEIGNTGTSGLEPSDIAKAYRKKFTEILIDEYQDTNMLQEEALYLISGNPDGEYNQVMVGDVKQSIYAFRHANPTLFLKKFDEFRKVDENSKPVTDGILKTLSKNYRSRKVILDAVNEIFCRVMTREIADIDYEKDGHKLIYPEKEDPKYNPEDDVNCELCWVMRPVEEGKKRGEKADPIEMEALAVARKILELKKAGTKLYDYDYDADKPKVSELRYGDICVLSNKNESLKKARRTLQKMGLPTDSDGTRFFFECEEVIDTMNLLKVADNPRNDIPLFALLLSDMFGFNEEELAIIKNEAGPAGSGKNGNFWDVLRNAAWNFGKEKSPVPRSPKAEEVLGRAREAVEQTNELRDFSEKINVSQFVWKAVNFNGYYSKCDEEAKGNLRALLEMSKPYDSGTNSGLHGFVTYLEEAFAKDNRPEAHQRKKSYAVPSAEPDKIRFMTVHGSKGLQFPVVFYIGTKGEPGSGGARDLKCDEENGIALPFAVDVAAEINNEEGEGGGFRHVLDTVPQKIIAKKRFEYSRKEAQRLVYVALTRAKERLYVTGCLDTKCNPKQAPWEQTDAIGADPLITTLTVKNAGSAFDLIWPAAASAEGRKTWKTVTENPQEWDIEALKAEIREQREKEKGASPEQAAGEVTGDFAGDSGGEKKEKPGFVPDGRQDGDAAETIARALEIADNGSLPKKISVSELKRYSEAEDGNVVFGRSPVEIKARKLPEGPGEAGGEETKDDPKPVEELKGAEFGTLMHKCARILVEDRKNWPAKETGNQAGGKIPDAAAVQGYVESVLERLYNEGVLDTVEFKSADAGMLAGFILSSRGAEVYRAEKVRCEVPFTYFTDVGKYWGQAKAVLAEKTAETPENAENGAGNIEDSLKTNLKEKKKIAIQGVVDLYYRIGERLVIVDFKTDSGKVPEGIPLINSYKLQLRCYRDAVKDISGQDADESVLYFLRSGCEYRVEMN